MTRRLYQALFLAVLIVCTILFSKEMREISQLFPYVDKIGHLVIFFLLAGFMHHAIKTHTWVYILLLILYAAGIELMQNTLPSRVGSITDFIADLIGILFYFSCYWIWQKNAKKAR